MRLLPVVLALLLVACAKPPTAEMNAAEAAVARAMRSPDVVAYAPEDLQRAKRALDQMKTEATARHYDQAKSFAGEATTAANSAIASAQTNKERAKARAEELIAAVKTALPQTVKILANAAKVSKAKFDRAAAKASIDGARTALAEAEAALGQGDFLKAVDRVASAQKALADTQSAIGAAVQGATRKK